MIINAIQYDSSYTWHFQTECNCTGFELLWHGQAPKHKIYPWEGRYLLLVYMQLVLHSANHPNLWEIRFIYRGIQYTGKLLKNHKLILAKSGTYYCNTYVFIFEISEQLTDNTPAALFLLTMDCNFQEGILFELCHIFNDQDNESRSVYISKLSWPLIRLHIQFLLYLFFFPW